MVWFYTLISVLVVSLISLVGVFTISLNQLRLEKMLHYLVSFAVGSLLGGAFIHILPGTIERAGGFSLFTSLHLPFGILLFFGLEKFVRWRHCHNIDCEKEVHNIVPMNIIGDAFHNFIDGIIIGTTYMVSIPTGVAATIAVAFHELPQEIGDFGVLLQGGLGKKKALLFNFLTGLTAIFGAIFALIVGPRVFMFTDALLPITAGGFIYIAGSDLIPILHRQERPSQSVGQILFILLGLTVMILLKLAFN
ncbi:ZIP family metal transporter [Candidatus Neomarinimicrobiota bacterium]